MANVLKFQFIGTVRGEGRYKAWLDTPAGMFEIDDDNLLHTTMAGKAGELVVMRMDVVWLPSEQAYKPE